MFGTSTVHGEMIIPKKLLTLKAAIVQTVYRVNYINIILTYK